MPAGAVCAKERKGRAMTLWQSRYCYDMTEVLGFLQTLPGAVAESAKIVLYMGTDPMIRYVVVYRSL